MKKDSNMITKVFYILGNNTKYVPVLILLFLFSSLLDVIGIGLIAPYISLLLDPKLFLNQEIFVKAYITLFGDELNDIEMISNIGYLLLFVFLVKTIFSIFVNYLILRFCFSIEYQLKSKLISFYQEMSFKTYLSKNSSYFMNNIQVVANKFSIGVLQSIFRVVSEAIIIIVILFFLGFNNFEVVIIATSIFILSIFAYDLLFKKKIKKYGEEVNSFQRKIIKNVQEALEGFLEIRILAKEKYFNKSLKHNANIHSKLNLKATNLSLIPRYLIELLLIIVIVTVIQFFIFNEQSLIDVIPMLSMFAVASIRVIPSMNRVSSSLTQIRFGKNFVDLLYNDFIQFGKNQGINKPVIDSNFSYFQSLALENCDFSYDKHRLVLRNINIEINKGDFIGIIGDSGSGKTTLVNLLLGLLEPDTGKIFLNKKNITAKYKELSSLVAYLPQDVFLLDDTIAKNIALGQSENEFDKEKIMKSIKKASLDEFISELPLGIETRIGQRGIQISGGQRQRLSLARAMYYDRSVLILDESTNSLDHNTEVEILNQIYSLKGSKTVIMISHNLASLSSCNKIFQVKNNTIILN